MNEAIINGISNKLFAVYGVQTANSDLQDDQHNDLAHYDHRTISEEDSYEIYVENVAQYLKRPCFLINLITSDLNMKLKPRYSFGSLFDVSNILDVSWFFQGCELFDALEYITLEHDILIRGTKMNFDILDNILHFRVSYNLILENKSDIIDMMEEQQNNIGVDASASFL